MLLRNLIPGLDKMLDIGMSFVPNVTLGGTIQSQDPYAVDQNYLQYMFGMNTPAKPCPRFQS